MQSKAFGCLGLCARAGKTASGEFQTENAIKSGRACLVLIAGDASENTKKHFRDMCGFAEIPFLIIADRESLGRAIGKEFRASCAVTDENLAKAFLKAYRQEEDHKEIVNGKNQGT